MQASRIRTTTSIRPRLHRGFPIQVWGRSRPPRLPGVPFSSAPGSPSKQGALRQDLLKLKGQRLTLPFLIASPAVGWCGIIGNDENNKEVIGLFGFISLFFFSGALQCVSQSAASRTQEIASHTRHAQEVLKEHRPDLAI